VLGLGGRAQVQLLLVDLLDVFGGGTGTVVTTLIPVDGGTVVPLVTCRTAVVAVEGRAAVVAVERRPAVVAVEGRAAVVAVEGRAAVRRRTAVVAVVPIEGGSAVIPVERRPAVIATERRPAVVPVERRPAVVLLEGGSAVVPLGGGLAVVPVEGRPAVVPVQGGPAVIPIEGGPAVIPVERGAWVVPLRGGPTVREGRAPLLARGSLVPTASGPRRGAVRGVFDRSALALRIRVGLTSATTGVVPPLLALRGAPALLLGAVSLARLGRGLALGRHATHFCPAMRTLVQARQRPNHLKMRWEDEPRCAGSVMERAVDPGCRTTGRISLPSGGWLLEHRAGGARRGRCARTRLQLVEHQWKRVLPPDIPRNARARLARRYRRASLGRGQWSTPASRGRSNRIRRNQTA
jgi:hypothetical protein